MAARLVWSCLALYVVFLTALELRQELWGLVLVAAGFIVLARRVIVSVDWTLLLVFMAMFIDVHLLTQLPALQGVFNQVGALSHLGTLANAIGLSQVISNVPSTILLLNYVPASTLLAWAVNIGGFGLLPGSLAILLLYGWRTIANLVAISFLFTADAGMGGAGGIWIIATDAVREAR
ncbi:membrane protein [Salmonella enterica subsp. enterica]|nr:membrane protein [Salmonella enterica subsp. enterica]